LIENEYLTTFSSRSWSELFTSNQKFDIRMKQYITVASYVLFLLHINQTHY